MIPDEQRAAMHDLATRMAVYRAALKEAGFSEHESLFLVIEFQRAILTMQQQTKGKGPEK